MRISVKKSLYSFLFLFFLCITLVSCTPGKQKTSTNKPAEDEYFLYYVSIDSTKLVTQKQTFNKEQPAYKQAEKMLKKLSNVEESLEYKSVLPDKVSVQNMYLSYNGTLTVDFSESYNHAVKSAQLLCKASLVKSLTQISGIDLVEFTVDTQPMMEDEETVGPLSAASFVDSENEADSKQAQVVTLYYSNQFGDRLKATRVSIHVDGNVSAEQLVLEQLINGTNVKGCYNTIPEGTKLLSVSTKDGVCYVDFNDKFMKLKDNVKDQVVIYSVVNSLCELSTVSKVSFTIEGKQEKIYNGNIAFDQLFERNLDIVDKK